METRISFSLDLPLATTEFLLKNSLLNTLRDSPGVALAFKPDGTRMFAVSGPDVDQYDLPVPWNLSELSFVSSFTTDDGFPLAVTFKPDGTRMFVVGDGADVVLQYELSMPWDVATAVNSGGVLLPPPSGIAFKPDGTRMFVSSGSNNAVYQYDLSAPWDTATASLVSTLDTTGTTTTPFSIQFLQNGTKAFLVSSSDEITRYDLPTAWDISTAVFAGAVFSDQYDLFSVAFSPLGTKMFLTGFSDPTRDYYTTAVVGG